MAIYRVWHGGDNTDGTTWAKAYTSVEAAIAKPLATGDVLYVHKAHLFQKAAAITWTFIAGNFSVICVDKDNSDAWDTGAIEEVASSGNQFLITGNASGTNLFMYGMNLKGSTGTSNANDIILKSGGGALMTIEAVLCTFTLQGTGASAYLHFGPTTFSSGDLPLQLTMRNCSVVAPNRAGGAIIFYENVLAKITGLSVSYFGASKPTILFLQNNSGRNFSEITVADSDLSGFDASSSSLVDVSAHYVSKFLFKNCKLSTNTTAKSGTWASGGGFASVTLINVDDADTIRRFEHYTRLGQITDNVAADSPSAVYTTGGASFNSVAVSWKVVTTADCNEYNPFVCPSLFRWNTSTASTDFNVQFLTDSVRDTADMDDREIWLELSYPSSASFPTGTLATDRGPYPFDVAGTDQTNGTDGSWTTTAITDTNEQVVTVTVTPAEVGLVEGVVKIGVASKTVYIDPVLRVAIP